MKTIMVYGVIGMDVLAGPFVESLSGVKGDVTVRINSLGGDVFAGLAIANAISARRYHITAQIDGVAASAATIIALAAHRVVIAENAHFMIHNPRLTAWDSQPDQLRSQLKALEDMQAMMVAQYSKKSGLAEARIRALMDAETWFTAAEAVSIGLVDSVIDAEMDMAAMVRCLPFDRFRYHNAPTLGETIGARPDMKTQLAAFLSQLMQKTATDARPEAVILSAVASACGADLAVIQAIFDGMRTITPTASQLDAFATALESDVELLKVEAGKDFDVFKAVEKPRVRAAELLDIEGAAAIGRSGEQKRVREIMQVFSAYAQYSDLRDECILNPTVSVDAATRLLLDRIGTAKPVEGIGSARIVEDSIDKMRAGMLIALTARGDQQYAQAHRAELSRNEFLGMRLGELARECVRREGGRYTGQLRDVVGRAFTGFVPGMGTGNFPVILEDIANKFLHQGWSASPETWRSWCAVRPMNDFKAHSFMNLSEFDDLLEVKEREEFDEAQFTEAGEKATLVTYGRLFSISRQAIINDDADAFTQVPMKMGRAAARKVGDLPYAVLTANANMADGTALFAAGHSNVRTGAGVPTTVIADALRVLLAKQTDPRGKSIFVRPQFLLCPIALEGQWSTVFSAESEVSSTSAERASRVPNTTRGLCTVVSDPRLDASSAVQSYMTADPNIYPGMIVGFLNGEDAPFLDSEDGWTVDGTRFKVRIDAVAKAIDWRAMVRNAGA